MLLSHADTCDVEWDEELDPDPVEGGPRPPINAALAERHPALFGLIKKCWHEDVEERPSFAGPEGIVQKLWGIINSMTMKRRRLSGDSSPVQVCGVTYALFFLLIAVNEMLNMF